jgi:pyruvate-formate lyase-activating enzyme
MFQKGKPQGLCKSNKSVSMLQSGMSQCPVHDGRTEICIVLLLYGCNLD